MPLPTLMPLTRTQTYTHMHIVLHRHAHMSIKIIYIYTCYYYNNNVLLIGQEGQRQCEITFSSTSHLLNQNIDQMTNNCEFREFVNFVFSC